MRHTPATVGSSGRWPSRGLQLGSHFRAVGRSAAVLSISLALQAQTATFIQDALLIDGTGREPQPHTDILIREGRIAVIDRNGSIPVPAGAMVVDASGKTVMPGIINIRGLAGLVRSPELSPDHFSRSSILRHLASYASYGVTTTATLGPAPRRLRAVRSAANTARALTPIRAICASIPAQARGTALEAAFEIVRTPEQAGQAVHRIASEGAEFIEFRDAETLAGDGEVLPLAIAAVRRANRCKLPAVVVTHRAALAHAALRTGARVIAASVNDTEVSAEFVAEAVATGVTYAPALFAESTDFAYEGRPEWIDDRYLKRSLPPGISGQLRGPVQVIQALDPDRALKVRRFDIARRNLRKLAAAGVPIALASGSGFPLNFEGYGEYREAALMAEAGLSSLQVIQAFSTGSAAALGIDQELGAVLQGHLADIVVLNANPLDNIHNLRDLHAVLVGGALMPL